MKSSQVFSHVDGVIPPYNVAILRVIIRTSAGRKYTVHTVHPSRSAPAVEFVKIVYSLNIGSIVYWRQGEFKMYRIIPAHSFGDIKYTLTFGQRDFRVLEYHAVLRNKTALIRLKL